MISDAFCVSENWNRLLAKKVRQCDRNASDHARMTAAPFLLHSHEYILRDDRFMVVLDVILRQCAVVLASFLVQEVDGVVLLQERTTRILLVLQHLPAFWYVIISEAFSA